MPSLFYKVVVGFSFALLSVAVLGGEVALVMWLYPHDVTRGTILYCVFAVCDLPLLFVLWFGFGLLADFVRRKIKGPTPPWYQK